MFLFDNNKICDANRDMTKVKKNQFMGDSLNSLSIHSIKSILFRFE